MQKNRTETNLSNENRLLKQKIKSLQSELEEKNREPVVYNDNFPAVFLKTILWIILLVCLYPFFRFGWFLITL